jgi:hypothetical protein
MRLTKREAVALLDILEDGAWEHGNELPHGGGGWPPYRCAETNRAYLKLLRIAGLGVNPDWDCGVR